jgi:hypothetical protein
MILENNFRLGWERKDNIIRPPFWLLLFARQQAGYVKMPYNVVERYNIFPQKKPLNKVSLNPSLYNETYSFSSVLARK